MDAKACFEDPGQQRPQNTAHSRQNQTHRDQYHLWQVDELCAPTGEDRTHDHLAFDPDVPQTGGEGHNQPGACQGQRYPEVEDAAELARVGKCAVPGFLEDFDRVAFQQQNEQRCHRQ